ncbi:MAG: hypothetical protein A3G66_01355 [Candidatus Levybacteria bacterium RIFCSPLOWO2_12_FULL_39_17]|nr:MAG: Glycosyl transferase family 2 [Candidatus Levybacteria bacterium GW2011_GWA1_39_11]OGD89856.1 MAG: hypothetical protein A2Z54_03200 [Candidatus Curtissbacteria bacterium RIFCSPHIGHO2_02_39_8]OGH15336.1 MAG: hypothetical protein A2689_02230 [Candidatus Levybacteria bacterium RIFCSPHIGHO2_01_FULL_38_96]OGH36368.1 MAG: hypothetical protein A3B43_02910 [Candidatus Levybacteria bacterium RIFCSPLOWO2_01_FULL_38_120]OGH47100.1 MAG: hypothetical protein A3G66_01355 [Candidatus Levybacteria bact
MNKLSVVISAYNEEKNIKDCLDSIKNLADEIVVVDNLSADKTAEIARNYTKKVFEQKNDPKNIDLQKNLGFSRASGDWILSLDADERATPELTREIKSVLSQKPTAKSQQSINGYWLPRKNIIFGKWIKSEMWWPDYQLKLFQKGKGGFDKNQVHRALRVQGETEKLENFLIHNNYVSISQYIEKLNNYTNIEAESLAASGYRVNWLDALRFPVDDFLKTFFLQKGYKEGLHGLILSLLQAFYMEIVFAKLWEREGFKEIEDADFQKKLMKEAKAIRNKFKYWFLSSTIKVTKNPFKKILLRVTRKITSQKLKNS